MVSKVNSNCIHFVSLVFGVISIAFFIVGCIGRSGEASVIKNVAWFTTSGSSDSEWKLSCGLRSWVNTTSSLDESSSDLVHSYGRYSECSRNGTGAFVMMVTASVFSFITVFFSGYLLCTNSKAIEVSNVAASLIAFATALEGVGLFMGNCFESTIHQGNHDLDFRWGPGAILSLVGMLLMFITFVMQSVVAWAGGDAYRGWSTTTTPPSTHSKEVVTFELPTIMPGAQDSGTVNRGGGGGGGGGCGGENFASPINCVACVQMCDGCCRCSGEAIICAVNCCCGMLRECGSALGDDD